jgi:hypothetical protein
MRSKTSAVGKAARKGAELPLGSESGLATLRALGDVLRGATIDTVWRQWAAVGGTAATNRPAMSLVDPEALVLGSLSLATWEPRLADILSDWVVRNSDLLSVQRIRNLAVAYPAKIRDLLAEVARIARAEGKDHRWKPLAEQPSSGIGLDRRTNKVRAVRVRVTQSAALMLRLRLAFGVGIKADVLTVLLTGDVGEWASVSRMAHATGYTVAAVRKAISDLAEARLIDSMAGTRTEYRAARPRWQALLGGGPMPAWRNWQERFVFVAAFFDWAADAERRPLTPFVLSTRGRELIEAHRAAFHWSGDDEWAGQLMAVERDPLGTAVRRLATWMEENV